jgi:DnaJ family protein C protein 2
MSFTAAASYTAAVKRPIEPVGPYFLAHATRTLKGHSWSEFEKIEAENNVVNVEEKDSDEDLFDAEINDPELLSHDAKDWKSCDLYAALGLSKLRVKATPDQIVKAHRKAVLQHHPDKKSSKGGSLDQDGFFKIIQKAFETLMDPAKRRQFDSVDDAADVSPPAAKIADEEAWYAAWAPVFAGESRFSNKQPVPSLGDANSTKEEVELFYKFWNNLDSWRTFEWLDEDVPDDSSNRDHKRYIEKKNNNSRKKKKNDDNKRLSDLVKRAQLEDPRIKKFKEEEKAEKARKKWEKEAGARQAEEEAKAKAEAEAKAKADAEAAAKSGKENAKKAKEAAKSAKKKNKRAIRAAAKDNEYFGDAGKAATIDAELDLLIESFDDLKLGEVAGKLKEANAEDAKKVLIEVATEQVAAGKVSSVSYFK